jgi:chromosome partitioning protein
MVGTAPVGKAPDPGRAGAKARVLTVAQQKGGAGKTTLVAQLAVAFATRGLRVALVDIDPQASLTRWSEARAEHGAADMIQLASVTGWRTQATVEKLVAAHDIVLIDSPPHADTEAKIAIRAADLVLVPIQPSPMDLWATEPTLALARLERRPALIVVNRIDTRMKLAAALASRIAGLGAPVAETRIGDRTAFAASMLDGRGVVETAPGTKAADEIAALASELMNLLQLS